MEQITTPEQIKKAAAQLLDLFGKDGEHWTRGTAARNKYGLAVDAKSSAAVKWCMLGGCAKLNINHHFFYQIPETKYAVARFNDADGFSPIKKLLTRIAEKGE